MRKVVRNSVQGPVSLCSPGKAGNKELDKVRSFVLQEAAERAAGRVDKTTFKFRAYKGDDVRHALNQLFYGKCAYCESRYDGTAPVDVEHFRPKGGVTGTDHPGYWWFAAEWTNLLPSCIDCNRRREQLVPTAFASLSGGLDQARKHGFTKINTGKDTAFPIESGGVRIVGEIASEHLEIAIDLEKALLIDPCRTDPVEHLRYYINRQTPVGLVYPAGSADIVLPMPAGSEGDADDIEAQARNAGVSVRGAVSIHLFGLNRLPLLQERTRILKKLEFLGSLIVEISAIADMLETVDSASVGDETVKTWAVERLRATVQRTLDEVLDMARPESVFSEMVKEWIGVFREQASTLSVIP